MIGVLSLVLPSGLSVICGLLDVIRARAKKTLAWIGLVLNGLLAGFFGCVVAFAS